MRTTKLTTPKMNKDLASDKPAGYCRECAHFILLNNETGMVRKHGRKADGVYCKGSHRAPSKAADSYLVKDWTPPRRSS